MKIHVWNEGPFTVSTDSDRLDKTLIHHELSKSYWAEEIPQYLVEKSIKNSLCFGVYENTSMVGFGRVVSDFSTFAYLADVFVVEDRRKRGISKLLMKCIMDHPELQGLRRFCLGTKDAHTLYQKFGFGVIKEPKNWMEIKIPGIYKKPKESRI